MSIKTIHEFIKGRLSINEVYVAFVKLREKLSLDRMGSWKRESAQHDETPVFFRWLYDSLELLIESKEEWKSVSTWLLTLMWFFIHVCLVRPNELLHERIMEKRKYYVLIPFSHRLSREILMHTLLKFYGFIYFRNILNINHNISDTPY